MYINCPAPLRAIAVLLALGLSPAGYAQTGITLDIGSAVPPRGLYATDLSLGHAVPQAMTGLPASAAAFTLGSCALDPLIGLGAELASASAVGADFPRFDSVLASRGIPASAITLDFDALTLGADVQDEDYFLVGDTEVRRYAGAGATLDIAYAGELIAQAPMPAVQLSVDYNLAANLLDDVVTGHSSHTLLADATTALSSQAAKDLAAALVADCAGRGVRLDFGELDALAGTTVATLLRGTDAELQLSDVPHDDLAAVTTGTATAGACASLATATSTGAGTWVHVEAGGQRVISVLDRESLGNLDVELFVNGGAVRESETGVELLDRSLALSSTSAPMGPVRVRVYFTAAEWAAFLGANDGDGNDVTVAEELAVSTFGGEACSEMPPGAAPTRADVAEVNATSDGYAADFEVASTGTLFFHGEAAAALPVRLTHSRVRAGDGCAATLIWESVSEEDILRYLVEVRSDLGSSWRPVASTAARGDGHYAVDLPAGGGLARVVAVGHDGERIAGPALSLPGCVEENLLRVWPNPITQGQPVTVSGASADAVLRVRDALGREVAAFRAQDAPAAFAAGKLKAGSYVVSDGLRAQRLVIR